MTSKPRHERIHELLTQALAPTHLEVVDESHRHVGHAGAKDGAGHFKVIISAAPLQDKSQLQAHRLIYQALGDLLKSEIHALSIIILQ